MNEKLESILNGLKGKLNAVNIYQIIDGINAHAPIYAWRLGLGPLVGKYIMIVTQINHKTGNPVKTALEFFELNGIKYVSNLAGCQQPWYRNLMANPRVTIQTADGTEQMVAVTVEQDDEMIQIIEWLLNRNAKAINQYMTANNLQLTRKDILKNKQDLIFLRFDPTSEPTPHGLEVDLAWIWPLMLIWVWFTKPKRRR